MSALLKARVDARPQVPASVEALTAIIDYYGFDHFFRNTLRMIDISDIRYADAIDGAIDRYAVDYEQTSFSVRRAFNQLLRGLMEDNEYSQQDALEVLAEEDYVVPTDIVFTYSVDAGGADSERLSQLIRNRARRMLKRPTLQ